MTNNRNSRTGRYTHNDRESLTKEERAERKMGMEVLQMKLKAEQVIRHAKNDLILAEIRLAREARS